MADKPFLSAPETRIYPLSAELGVRDISSSTRLRCHERMNNPVSTILLTRLTCTVLLAGAATLRAEPPDNHSNKTRTKPQIIYHLPPSSPYAERLHSQAKGQSSDVPVDSSMPSSVQTSNGSAAPAPQQSAAPQPAEGTVKPRMRASRMQSRPRSFAKPAGHGNAHGNRSHKK